MRHVQLQIAVCMNRDMTKPTMWLCAQRRLRSAWASAQSDQSSLSVWRNLGSLATHWVHSEDSYQTGQMSRPIWVFATLMGLGRCPGWSESSLGAHSFRWFCHVAAHISIDLGNLFVWHTNLQVPEKFHLSLQVRWLHHMKLLTQMPLNTTERKPTLTMSHIMRKPVLPYANNKSADQPAHPCSLISAFVVRCLDSIIPSVSISKISSFYLVPVTGQTGLSLTWSKTPKTGFLVTRLKYTVPVQWNLQQTTVNFSLGLSKQFVWPKRSICKVEWNPLYMLWKRNDNSRALVFYFMSHLMESVKTSCQG